MQAKLAALKTEKQNLTKSCADLEKIATQIPSVQSPTDVDAEESSFESQFNGLARDLGRDADPVQRIRSGLDGRCDAGHRRTPARSSTPPGVVAVPTTLTVTGNYGQMTAFINGLDNFPRLFVIQTFNLTFGTRGIGLDAACDVELQRLIRRCSGASPTGTPLWVGGTPTSPSAGPYSLAITGSIYYTSTPNALAACTKADQPLDPLEPPEP